MSNAAPKSSPVRPGRPVEFARDEAIDLAMHLFWKKGYLSVSATDLADTMGIQRSSFYNSFGTREAVFVEALHRYARLTPDGPLFTISPDDNVARAIVDVLHDICRVRTADQQARGCLVCNSIAELVGVDDALGPLLAGFPLRLAAVMRDLLAHAAKKKEIRCPPDLDAAADGFVAFLIGLNTLSKVIRDERQLWRSCIAFLKSMGFPDRLLDCDHMAVSA